VAAGFEAEQADKPQINNEGTFLFWWLLTERVTTSVKPEQSR
jgi:hypothetical protein